MSKTATATHGPIVEVKADSLDENGMFEGYAARFGEVDRGGDTIEKGAFKKSLAAHRKSKTLPALLLHHDSWQPAGVWTEMAEDDTGLRVKGKLLMDVQHGREAHAMLKAGALRGLSIGFRTIKALRDDETATRILKEVELWEISLVTFPMQRTAGIDAVKFTELEGGVDSLSAAEAVLRDEAGFSGKAATRFVSRIIAIDRARRDADAEAKAAQSSAARLLESLKN